MPYYLAEDGVGYLTFEQFDRLRRAWSDAIKLLPWWWVAGQIRSGDIDEMRVRSSDPALPLPATWLAAHEITRLMQELNGWLELEDVAHDAGAAELALLLTKEVETAAAKWPFSDRSHKVSYFRCQACQQMTLRYMPPNDNAPSDAVKAMVHTRIRQGRVRVNPETLTEHILVNGKTIERNRVEPRTVRSMEIADVVVRCANKECGAVMDSHMFELAVHVIQQEQEIKKNAKRRLDPDNGSADESREVESDNLSVDSSEENRDDPAGGAVVAVLA
jgi:hypothetical protein